MNNTAFNHDLYTKISVLPDSLKTELLDYLEFLMTKHQVKKTKKHPKAGCMKGTFKMSDDFNEPLEDFKDYM